MALSAFQAGSLALTAATTAYSAYAQNQNAQHQADAISNNYKAQLGQQAVAQKQMADQAAQQESQVAREATQERAKLTTTAGEMGMTGGVLDRLNSELSFRESDALQTIATNRGNALLQSGLEGQAMRARAVGQINSLSAPTWLGTGLQLAGLAGDKFGAGKKIPNSTYTGLIG
ncbi:hypothetical protein ASC76_19165 [Rhizobacter sp. Root404]|nr:hypothetical protein ASC76_19165 [Rhizobacter sp. Root404]